MGDLISIIIPTYNRAKLIQRSLKSIETQTLKNYEIIVLIIYQLTIPHPLLTFRIYQ